MIIYHISSGDELKFQYFENMKQQKAILEMAKQEIESVKLNSNLEINNSINEYKNNEIDLRLRINQLEILLKNEIYERNEVFNTLLMKESKIVELESEIKDLGCKHDSEVDKLKNQIIDLQDHINILDKREIKTLELLEKQTNEAFESKSRDREKYDDMSYQYDALLAENKSYEDNLIELRHQCHKQQVSVFIIV